MMSKFRQIFSSVITRLGLDWFVILIGKPAFKEATIPYPETLQEVREKFGDLTDEEKLDDAMEFCTDLLEREESRSDKVESKAFILISITGIATAFIIGFAGVLLDTGKLTSIIILILAAVLYILVVISFIWTIFLSVKVVTVGDYEYTYPSANDIFDLSDKPLQSVRQERVASLFISFVRNNRVVNIKATFLKGSQLWFRNSIILLLVLTLFLAIYSPLKSYLPGNLVLSPTKTQSYSVHIPENFTSTPPSQTITPTQIMKPKTPIPRDSLTSHPNTIKSETITP